MLQGWLQGKSELRLNSKAPATIKSSHRSHFYFENDEATLTNRLVQISDRLWKRKKPPAKSWKEINPTNTTVPQKLEYNMNDVIDMLNELRYLLATQLANDADHQEPWRLALFDFWLFEFGLPIIDDIIRVDCRLISDLSENYALQPMDFTRLFRSDRSPFTLHHLVLDIARMFVERVMDTSSIVRVSECILITFDTYPSKLYGEILKLFDETIFVQLEQLQDTKEIASIPVATMSRVSFAQSVRGVPRLQTTSKSSEAKKNQDFNISKKLLAMTNDTKSLSRSIAVMDKSETDPPIATDTLDIAGGSSSTPSPATSISRKSLAEFFTRRKSIPSNFDTSLSKRSFFLTSRRTVDSTTKSETSSHHVPTEGIKENMRLF
jgi:hypothetical protein